MTCLWTTGDFANNTSSYIVRFACEMPLSFLASTPLGVPRIRVRQPTKKVAPIGEDRCYFFGGPGGTRTLDTLLKRQVL